MRRASCRDIYERGGVGKTRPPVWLQLAHLALSGVVPQLRRATRGLSAVAYAAYGWTAFALMSPLLWLAVATLPPSWRWPACAAGLGLLARATCTRLSLRGSDKLLPPERTCMFVSNHASYLDGFVLMAVLPRQVAFVAKAELLAHWPTRIPLSRLGAAFVERFDTRKGIDDARGITEIARAGRASLFFAEGTFTRMPGLLPFHMGAFVAAAETNTPVVPIAIRGTRSILRADSWFPRHGAISVFVGEPIFPDAIGAEAGDSAWTRGLKIRDRARREILRYCGEPDLGHERPPLWTGTPADAPKSGEE